MSRAAVNRENSAHGKRRPRATVGARRATLVGKETRNLRAVGLLTVYQPHLRQPQAQRQRRFRLRLSLGINVPLEISNTKDVTLTLNGHGRCSISRPFPRGFAFDSS